MSDNALINSKRTLYSQKINHLVSTLEEVERLKLRVSTESNLKENETLHLKNLYCIDLQVELRILDEEINGLTGFREFRKIASPTRVWSRDEVITKIKKFAEEQCGAPWFDYNDEWIDKNL